MTQDEIIEMANQAGLPTKHPDWIKAYLAFTKLVAQYEREACAKVAEQHSDTVTAAFIRARGENK